MCAYNPSTVYSNPMGWESQRWARERERERDGSKRGSTPSTQTTTTAALKQHKGPEHRQTRAADRGLVLLNY